MNVSLTTKRHNTERSRILHLDWRGNLPINLSIDHLLSITSLLVCVLALMTSRRRVFKVSAIAGIVLRRKNHFSLRDHIVYGGITVFKNII